MSYTFLLLAGVMQLGHPQSAVTPEGETASVQAADAMSVKSETGWVYQETGGADMPPQLDQWMPLDALTSQLPKRDRSTGDASFIAENVWLEKDFDVPTISDSEAIWIRFPRLEGEGILYVNGLRVKELLRPDWEADITSYVKPGESAKIRLYLTRVFQSVSRKQSDDRLIVPFLATLGRKPETIGMPVEPEFAIRGRQAYIHSPQVISKVEDWELVIKFTVGGEVSPDTEVAIIIRDVQSGEIVSILKDQGVKIGSNEISMEFDGQPWYLDDPYLYSAELTLVENGDTLDHQPAIIFGFRELEVRGRHVMLNGRVCPWRLFGPFSTPVDTNGPKFEFYREIGYNVLEIQPHPLRWWGFGKTSWPYYPPEILDDYDKEGVGLLIPVPPPTMNTGYSMPIVEDEETRRQYADELKAFITPYINHPSIQAWLIAMNVIDYPSYAENISPKGMGTDVVDVDEESRKARALEEAIKILREIDPTRPVYAHASGNIGGDIAGGNQHLNFVPLAEKEAWPSYWHEHGLKPWTADECGQPYIGNFALKNYKQTGNALDLANQEIAFTEYCAMEWGDDAYLSEPDEYRKNPKSYIMNLENYGVMTLRGSDTYASLPALEKFMIEYGVRHNRAWRTWQVQGWIPWIMEWSVFWQNPSAESALARAYAETMHPFLAYIGGGDEFYDRTHAYYSGEAIKKKIVTIFDGPQEDLNPRVEWKVTLSSGEVVASGTETISIFAGEVTFTPIQFEAPVVSRKETATMVIECTGIPYTEGTTDTQTITIWPRQDVTGKLGSAWIVDPLKDSTEWLRDYVTPVGTKNDANPGVLILGRRALASMETLPFTSDDIAAGLRVLILEQSAEDLLRLGFRNQERGIRKAFIRESSDPIFLGMSDDDLRDWRGAASLLPAHEGPRYWWHRSAMYGMKPQRMTRWGNHGNVASVVIETPHRGNFRPLAECGFDLAYSPLVAWKYGKGEVLFCQFDLTGRVGAEPAATELASRIIRSLYEPMESADRPVDVSEGLPSMPWSELGFAAGSGANSIEVLKLQQFGESQEERVRLGGRALVVAGEMDADGANGTWKRGVTAVQDLEPREISGHFVGPGLLRWRAPLDLACDPDGKALAEWDLGNGMAVFCGVPSDAFANTPDSVARISKLRIGQLYNRLLAFLGAETSEPIAKRVTTLVPYAEPKGRVNVQEIVFTDLELSGPYSVGELSGEALLDAATRPAADSWVPLSRLMALGDDGGYGGGTSAGNSLIDLTTLYGIKPDPRKVVWLRGEFEAPKSGNYNFYLRADYWAELYVDGEEVAKLGESTGPSDAIRVSASKDLAAGRHQIVIKTVSGTNGFNIFATADMLDKPRDPAAFVEAPHGKPLLTLNPEGVSLYLSPMKDNEDPYLYYTW